MNPNPRIHWPGFGLSMGFLVAAAFVLSSHRVVPKRPAVDKRPNIVVIVTDDQSIESLGCYGNKVIQTPHIDRLAAEGVKFTRNFSNSSSCSPNRSVILTGLHNHTNGMYGLTPPPHNFSTFPTIVAFPTRLKQAGYATALVGKYHVAPKSVYQFDQLSASDARDHQQLTETSRAFIQSLARPGESPPFLLFYCSGDPHEGGGKVASSPFRPDRYGNREEGYAGIREIRYSPQQVIVPPYLPDTPETRAELAQFYQSVSRLDQGVGKLVQVLKETGVYDNTIIFFTSDNGHALPGVKATLYDAGIHLPLIVRSPFAKKRGIENNAMVSFVDLAPTILDMAGVKTDSLTLHGRSFRAVLDTENPAGWDEVYGSQTFHLPTWYYPRRMVRTTKFKLIRNTAYQLDDPAARQYHQTWLGVVDKKGTHYGLRSLNDLIYHPEYELFNVEADPNELDNLYKKPGYEAVFAQLVKKLDAFQKRTIDPWAPDNLRKP